MKKRRSRALKKFQGEVWIYVALLVGGLLLQYFLYDLGLLEDDEFYFANAAWRVLGGDIPFRDYFSKYPGGFDLFNALLLKVFGVSLVSLRLGGFLVAATMPGCVYFVARQVMSRWFALVPAVFTLFLLRAPYTNTIFYTTWLFVVAVGCVLGAYRMGHRRRVRNLALFGAGVAAGISLSFRQNGGLICLLFVVIACEYFLARETGAEEALAKGGGPGFSQGIRLAMFLGGVGGLAVFLANPVGWRYWPTVFAVSLFVVVVFLLRSHRISGAADVGLVGRFSRQPLWPEAALVLGFVAGIMALAWVLVAGGVAIKALLSLKEISLLAMTTEFSPTPIVPLTWGGACAIAGLIVTASAPMAVRGCLRGFKPKVVAIGGIYAVLGVGVLLAKRLFGLGISAYIQEARVWFPLVLIVVAAGVVMFDTAKAERPGGGVRADDPVPIVLIAVCLAALMALPHPENEYLNNLYPALFILSSYLLYRWHRRLQTVEEGRRLGNVLVATGGAVAYGVLFLYLVVFGDLRGFVDLYPVQGQRHMYKDLVRTNVPTMRVRVAPDLAEGYERMYARLRSEMRAGDLMFAPVRANANFLMSMRYPTYINDPSTLYWLARQGVAFASVVDDLKKNTPEFIAVVGIGDRTDHLFRGAHCDPSIGWSRELPQDLTRQDLTSYIESHYDAIYQWRCYHIFKRRISEGATRK